MKPHPLHTATTSLRQFVISCATLALTLPISNVALASDNAPPTTQGLVPESPTSTTEDTAPRHDYTLDAAGEFYAMVRASGTILRRSNTTSTKALGATAELGNVGYYHIDGLWSVRTALVAAAGATSAGFAGELLGDGAIGLRVNAPKHPGPFARLGTRLYIRRDNELLESLIELPQLQIGFQLLSSRANVFELAGRMGPVLFGRSNTGDTNRSLSNNLEVGGHLAVRWELITLDAQHTHIFSQSPLGHVDMVSSRMCAHLFLASCLDARLGFGRESVPGPDNSIRAVRFYGIGLSFGIMMDYGLKGVFGRPRWDWATTRPVAPST